MFSFLRKKLKFFFILFFLILIVFAFVFTGLNNKFLKDENNFSFKFLKINDQNFNFEVIDHVYKSFYKENIKNNYFIFTEDDEFRLRDNISIFLMENFLIIEDLLKFGFNISKEEMYYYKLYESDFLSLSYLSEYDSNINLNLKYKLLYNQLFYGLIYSNFILKNEFKYIFNYFLEKKDFSVIVFLKNNINELNSFSYYDRSFFYFKKNEISFKDNLNVNFTYLSLLPNDIISNIRISDFNINKYYIENFDFYLRPTLVKLKYIFISNNFELGDIDKIKNKINRVLFNLNVKKVSFDDLISRESDDYDILNNNGEIGWVGKNEITEKIESFIFNLKNIDIDGQLYNFIEGEKGFYIFKLIDFQSEKRYFFDQVKNEIEFVCKFNQSKNLFLNKDSFIKNYFFDEKYNFDNIYSMFYEKIKYVSYFSRFYIQNFLFNQDFFDRVFDDFFLKGSFFFKNNENYFFFNLIDCVKEKIFDFNYIKYDIKKYFIDIEMQTYSGILLKYFVKDLNRGLFPIKNFKLNSLNLNLNHVISRNDVFYERNLMNEIFIVKNIDFLDIFNNLFLFNGNYILISNFKFDDSYNYNYEVFDSFIFNFNLKRFFIETYFINMKNLLKNNSFVDLVLN